jgi:hypothetical protein
MVTARLGRRAQLNFAYREANETKNALVKLRVCPE